ncbi:MAG: hypothetical protein IJW48_02000 [Clostridia bacterium]|nr:hypothetical protein [Clostridia bacterium]
MFRLVKINYAGSNAPKYERFSRVGCNFIPKAGVAVDRIDNTITAAGYYPRFIVAKDYKATGNEPYLCYEVTDNMVFKVEIVGDEPVELGRPVGISSTGELTDAVEINEEGSGRIVGLCDNPKYVYVKFDRKREYEEW